MVLKPNTTRPMKIYTITPSFDEQYLPKIEAFFRAGNEFLQLRDKSADIAVTIDFIKKVKLIAKKYPQVKLMINGSNNYNLNGVPLIEHFKLFGVHQSIHNDKSSEHFCPDGKFNLLSCHTKTDINFAVAAGFKAITLSPVFPTKSHPEQTETLGFENFSKLCRLSQIPVFGLGGVTLEMLPQFKEIKGCTGIAMIRGWFDT